MSNTPNVSIANYHHLQIIRKVIFFLFFTSCLSKSKELGTIFLLPDSIFTWFIKVFGEQHNYCSANQSSIGQLLRVYVIQKQPRSWD